MKEPSDHEPDLDPRGVWDPQGLWQAQTKELDPVTLAQIHAKAVTFEKQVHLRAACGYLSFGFGIVVASATATLAPHQSLLMRAAYLCMILGLVFAGWQLFRRTSPQSMPLIGESLMDAYRRQLIRQRDAARTEFWWAILPLVPGLALMLAGLWIKGPASGGALRFYVSMTVFPAVLAVGFAFAAYLIRRNVQRLQGMIDAL
jgi:hypothetical protein